jgi:serine phosphatase RsbU (regulator of sigma subunit)/anti-sigma regulatory factor (Ser/Thr protein kinase)
VLGIYLVALAVYLIAPYLAITWREKPFLGFVIEQTMVVSDYNGENWSGRLAGIEYPEKITHINGILVENQLEFQNTLEEMLPGQEVRIQTLLPDGFTKTYSDIRAMFFPRNDFLRLFWMPYLVGAVYLAIAGWVYRARGNTPPGRSFVLFCISSALAIGLLFDLITTHFLSALWLFAISSLGGALVSLSMQFPEESKRIHSRVYLRYMPYLISLGLLIWGAIYLYSTSTPWQYIQTWRISYAYSALGILIFIGMMIYRLVVSKSPLVQQQVRTILVGSIVSFIPVTVWMASPVFGKPIPWNPLVFLPILLLFPLTIAIAIVRYRLWDIEVIINRTLVYTTLTIILGSFYFLSVVSLQIVVSGMIGDSSPIAITASTLGVALLFNPVRRRVQDFIDRRFFRRRYDITKTMAEFIGTLRDEVNLDNLTNALISVVDETMKPRTISFCDCLEGNNKFANLPLDDPFRTYMLNVDDVIDVDKLMINSPAVEELNKRSASLAIPLISQGEPVGVLMIGARKSGQPYSNEDRRLLNMLASQVAPALRVAQLVRQQKEEALKRQRVEQELNIARMIQQALIPKKFPDLEGWEFAGFYEPARAVGGDFYDFINFPDGRIGIFIGDVADKGIPAALVMANTRSLLRSTAYHLISPSAVLQKVNDLLTPEVPEAMFVTCFYAVIEPNDGKITFANAGHNLPLMTVNGGVEELYATGMPLGWMTGKTYDEKEIYLAQGESIVLYSDGLVEAHDENLEMFGNPRVESLLTHLPDKLKLVDLLIDELKKFTQFSGEQEDDVTLVTIHRQGGYNNMRRPHTLVDTTVADRWELLSEFSLPSEKHNEIKAVEYVSQVIDGLGISDEQMESLMTAVAESVMNAIEHGNQYNPNLEVEIRILTSRNTILISVADQGEGGPIPNLEKPDLFAKLAGEQSPRGWGFFLIERMVDRMVFRQEEGRNIIDLYLNRE